MPSLRKLHLGDGRLTAIAIRGTVWEELSATEARTDAATSAALPVDELRRLFAVAQAEAPAAERAGMRRSVTGIAAKVTLLDSKQSHLKAIGIHALAASLSSAPGRASLGTL